MIKGRISLRPEAGRWESDMGKVGQEGKGKKLKDQEGDYSAFLRAATWYYELEERRK